MAEIILDKINYTYSDGTAYEIQALKDVNLQIHQGEFIGIIPWQALANCLTVKCLMFFTYLYFLRETARIHSQRSSKERPRACAS